jgi:non-ribosomal peptide synthetase component F
MSEADRHDVVATFKHHRSRLPARSDRGGPVAAAAAAQPDAVAVVDGVRLSQYGALDRRRTGWRGISSTLGRGPRDVVGVS